MPRRKMDANLTSGVNADKLNPRTNKSKQTLMQRKNILVMIPMCGVVMLRLAGVWMVTVTVLPTPVHDSQGLLKQNTKCNCSKRGRG